MYKLSLRYRYLDILSMLFQSHHEASPCSSIDVYTVGRLLMFSLPMILPEGYKAESSAFAGNGRGFALASGKLHLRNKKGAKLQRLPADRDNDRRSIDLQAEDHGFEEMFRFVSCAFLKTSSRTIIFSAHPAVESCGIPLPDTEISVESFIWRLMKSMRVLGSTRGVMNRRSRWRLFNFEGSPARSSRRSYTFHSNSSLTGPKHVK